MPFYCTITNNKVHKKLIFLNKAIGLKYLKIIKSNNRIKKGDCLNFELNSYKDLIFCPKLFSLATMAALLVSPLGIKLANFSGLFSFLDKKNTPKPIIIIDKKINAKLLLFFKIKCLG